MTHQKIENYISTNKKDIFQFLADLVNINSFHSNIDGLVRVGNLINAWGKEHGFHFDKIYKDKNESNPFHLYFNGQTEGDFLGVVGHIDTVHTHQSPFNNLDDHGLKMAGPGVLDMKGGLVAALYALDLLKELQGTDDLPVRMIINCDEETGSLDSRPLIEEKFNNAVAAFVFEGRYESDQAIVTARKGIIMCHIDVFGISTHAGESPQEGANAVVEMAEKIVRLQKLTDSPLGTTVSPDVIKGGVAANIIPDHCKADVDVRFPDPEAEKLISKEIAKILEANFVSGTRTEYKLTKARPAFVRSKTSEQLRDLYFDTASKFELYLTEKSAGGCSDANLIGAMGIPTLDSLGPDGGYPHTNKEYIVKESLNDCIKVTALFLSRLIQSFVK